MSYTHSSLPGNTSQVLWAAAEREGLAQRVRLLPSWDPLGGSGLDVALQQVRSLAAPWRVRPGRDGYYYHSFGWHTTHETCGMMLGARAG